MAPSIFWYDYETTGTDPARDRAVQFAGIRTNRELEVIEEPVNLWCYPGDDVIPVPEAIAVTGIRMSELEAKGLCESDFAARVLAELGRAQTCGTGFNSIRFDDEFTRHLFYRNFIDPYAREWQNDNARWDVIDMFRMCQALRPDGLEWPRNEAGEPVFRLEALTAANGIAHEDAHEALADVVATIEMVKKLKAAQPRLFDYLFRLRQKRAVVALLYPLGKFPLVHTSSMYGAARQFTTVVLPLCTHPTNSNGVICYDLAFDPAELIELGPAALHRRLFTPNDELAENESRIHLKTIHVNRSPAIAPLAALLPADAERLGIDLAACERHRETLARTSGIVEKVQDAFAATDFPEVMDPDLMLYTGDFFSDHDRALMRELRDLAPAQLATAGGVFDDARVDEMIFRYRARNWPDSLSAEEHERWEAYRRESSCDGQRVRDVLKRIAEMTAADGPRDCLDDLDRWLRGKWQGYAG